MSAEAAPAPTEAALVLESGDAFAAESAAPAAASLSLPTGGVHRKRASTSSSASSGSGSGSRNGSLRAALKLGPGVSAPATTRVRKAGSVSETPAEPASPRVGGAPATARLSASKLKPPGVGLLSSPGLGLHAKKPSVGGSASARESSSASAIGSPAPVLKKKPLTGPAAFGSPLVAAKKNSLPKKSPSSLLSSTTALKTPSRSGSVSLAPSAIPAPSASTPSTPTHSHSGSVSSTTDDESESSSVASAAPAAASAVKRPSTAGPSSSLSASGIKKRPVSALAKPPTKLAAALGASPAAAPRKALSSTTASPSLLAKRPSALGVKRLAPASAAGSEEVASGAVGSTFTFSSDESAELAALRASFMAQASTLARVEAELAAARKENAALSARIAAGPSAPSSPTAASAVTFTSGPQSALSVTQATRIHELTTSLKNLEQTYQAQREQVEGCMGFAPVSAAGKALPASALTKKFEESVQDLQFQLLYGETGKDIQLARLTDQHLQSQQAQQQDRYELARLKQQLMAGQEEKVEHWLLTERGRACM